MSEKYDKFKAALEALCREHKAQIAASRYDGIQIWDLKEGDDPIYCDGIADMTKVE